MAFGEICATRYLSGGEAAPFVACMRWEDSRVVVEVIAGCGQATGRMDRICDLLERLVREVVFEEIVHGGLEEKLHRRGYRLKDRSPCGRPSLVRDLHPASLDAGCASCPDSDPPSPAVSSPPAI